MKLNISYSKDSDKFINKNSHILSKDEVRNLLVLSIKKLFKIEIVSVDLKKLEGYKNNTFRVRKGKIRIIFTYENNEIIVVSVHKIDFRGDVYKD